MATFGFVNAWGVSDRSPSGTRNTYSMLLAADFSRLLSRFTAFRHFTIDHVCPIPSRTCRFLLTYVFNSAWIGSIQVHYPCCSLEKTRRCWPEFMVVCSCLHTRACVWSSVRYGLFQDTSFDCVSGVNCCRFPDCTMYDVLAVPAMPGHRRRRTYIRYYSALHPAYPYL